MAVLTEEQAMLRDMAAGWVRDRRPLSHARRRFDDPARTLDEVCDTHREMAEMGWTGVTIGEADGGSDFGAVGLGLLLEQLGRSLVASPLLATGVAALALRAAGATRWLPGIADGSVIAALAIDEGAHHRPDAVSTVAAPSGEAWRLSGTKRPVPDAMVADLLLVTARIEGRGGVRLFAVPADADGITRTPLDQIDATQPAIVTLADVAVPADAVLDPDGAGDGLAARTLDAGRLGLTAEMLGTAEAAFDIITDYLRTRVQFDRPIGSFQALQHRAAAMFGELQLLRSAVEAGLAALDGGADTASDVPALASLAKALAGDTLRLVTNEMVQMHGGIGMTHEHDAGLFLKRARVAGMQFGNAAFHRERWGRMQGF